MLIVGSWIATQKQLDSIQHDIKVLVQNQNDLQ